MSFQLVIIESRLAGDVASNLAYARCLMRFCLRRGQAPFASHCLYPQVLDDNIPDERALGIAAGLAWGNAAALTVVGVDLGVSDGMRRGIAHARACCRQVEFVSLAKWRPSRAKAWELVYALELVQPGADVFTLEAP